MTISHAYDMLVNYCNPRSTFCFDCQDHGVSFYTEEDGNKDDTDTCGISGGRGQGRGRGNGYGRGGRGQGRYGRGPSASVQVNEETNEPCEHENRPQLILAMMLLHTCDTLHLSRP